MMGFFLYIFAIVIVRCYTHSVGPGDEDYEVLQEKFRDIPLTMLSLFEMMAQPELINIFHNARLRGVRISGLL